jgi:hypothetical protein
VFVRQPMRSLAKRGRQIMTVVVPVLANVPPVILRLQQTNKSGAKATGRVRVRGPRPPLRASSKRKC